MANSDNNIERKIKEGFEGAKHKAPENLWSAINNRLDGNAAIVDDTVKSSFENKNSVAPTGVWEEIDKQLTIDRGWAKVHTLLQRKTFYKWTKRVAAMLIVLFFVASELNNMFSEKETVKRSKNENKVQLKEKQETVSQDQQVPVKKTSGMNQSNVGKSPDLKDYFINSNQSLNNDDINKNGILTQLKTENTNFNYGLNEDVLQITTTANGSLNSIADTEKHNIVDSLNSINLPIKNINSLTSDNQYVDLIDFKENIHNETKFEVGLYTVLNSTAILNNATRRALNAKSLVAFNPSFGTNLGLQFVYHFDTKHSLASALMYSNVSQSYNKFSKGNLNEEVLNMNFVRLQTLYQFKYKRHESQKLAINVKAGPYLGYMASSNYSVNDKLITESFNSFKDVDFGVTLQAGQSIDYNKLILDYGLNIDKGITNLNKGTNLVPASFDRTSLLGLGVYVSVRYKL